MAISKSKRGKKKPAKISVKKKASVKRGPKKSAPRKPVMKKKSPARKTGKKSARTARPRIQKRIVQEKPRPEIIPAFKEPPSLPRQTAVKQPVKVGKKRPVLRILLILLLIPLIVIGVLVLQKKITIDSFTRKADKVDKARDEQALKPTADQDLVKKRADELTAMIKKEERSAEKKVIAPIDESDLYTVQVKDSLVQISEKTTGDYKNWMKIYQANKDTVKDPTIIFPGQKLRIPKK